MSAIKLRDPIDWPSYSAVAQVSSPFSEKLFIYLAKFRERSGTKPGGARALVD